MAFQSQFKTIPKMCRNGTRENCPVNRCRFQHSMPADVIYSSALKGAVPPPPSPATSPTRTHFPSTAQGTRGWCDDGKAHTQHIHPSVENAVLIHGPRDPPGTFDANALAQATDGLAIYRAWLESQVEVQKAKIQAMSKQYSIPIPQLDLDPLDFPPLGMIPPTMANTLPSTAITATRDLRGQQSEVQPTPQAPRLEPAQAFPRAPTHVPESAATTNRYCHEHEVPISATSPGGIVISTHEEPDSSTAAPRKIDMSYKTTPCRHFTLNRGWCPWGDDCCFIHDPALDWVPPPERGSSGRSTPSSTTLVGGNYNKPVQNGTVAGAPEPSTAQRSSSSQSAHCWGYIQGLCPHSGDTCKFIHPSNIVPYMKYTPCLMWPRCGYPSQVCPLKHPQVDKLSMHGQHAEAHGTAPPVVPQPQPQTAAPYADEQHCRLAFPIASLQGAPPSLIISHDAAYASAVQYHNPIPPSAETFSPPPPRVAVRLSRPSDAGRVPADHEAVLGGPGVRGRRVSIAVQRPGVEFAGGASGEYMRGHGRGRSMQL